MTFEDLFGKAQWMSPQADCLTPLCRCEFTADTAAPIKQAVLTICGLGFFEAFLNGRRIGDDLFVPPDTNYHARPMLVNDRPFAEVMGSRILCLQYNVDGLLADGRNVLAVRLAPGYYHYGHITPFGPVRLCFRLQLTGEDGSVREVLSGPALRWHESEVTRAEFTIGEDQDYTRLPADWLAADCAADGWQPMLPSPLPDTRYELTHCPADRVIRTLTPVCIFRRGQTAVYDLGENIAGRPLLECAAGAEVTVRFAEERTPDGQLDETSVQALYGQRLSVRNDGTPRTVTARTTWFAARYLEVTGDARLTAFEEIHADVAVTGRFDCSDPVLNWLFEAYLRTQLANLHGGIPSDCPHIERRGYTGDGQLTAETAMQLLDGEAFYRKWMEDISDSQDRLTGHVPYTAPFVSSGGGPGGWGCAIVEVPYVFWRVYGDKGPAQRMYPQMLHWFDYLDAHSEEGLVTSEEPGNWCLGDWCTAEKTQLPEPYVNTYFYAKSLRRALELCPPEDRAVLQARLDARLQALCRHYWDAATGSFCGGIQGADAFALDLGLGDERTLKNLVQKYRALGCYDTGIFGTDILTRVLFERGQGELALALMASRGRYGYANWMRQGATTLWEYWTGERSHSHPMFGAAVRYLHQYVLGIRQLPDSAGFDRVLIAPARLPALAFARGALRTPHGELAVEWARLDDRIQFAVTLPQGVSASLCWNGETYALQPGCQRFTFSF